jgi:hypothetical protein
MTRPAANRGLPMPGDAPRMAPLGRLPLFAVAQLAAMGGLAWTWLAIAGVERGAVEALICAAAALLALALGFTSQADREQYVLRLVACAALLPILLMMWAGSQDAPEATPAMSLLARRPWIFFVAFGLLHALVFVAAIVWLAGTVTRVEAPPGSTAVPAALLMERIRSLAAEGVPFDLTNGVASGEWVLALREAEAERSHRVLLQLDERSRTVRVRERVGASGARPRNAEEASMRGIGDDAVDPTRPAAQRISSRAAQARMIDPARLQAVRVELSADRALPARDTLAAAASDPDALVMLLCAVVTRSGWAWQPLLFGEAPRADR